MEIAGSIIYETRRLENAALGVDLRTDQRDAAGSLSLKKSVPGDPKNGE
jgi:hypothetical protein